MLSDLLAPLLLPSLIIAIVMLPLAYQDWRNRKKPKQISVLLVVGFSIISVILFGSFQLYGYSAYLNACIIVDVVCLLMACVFYFSGNIAITDLLVVMLTILASSIIGSFAFLFAMLVVCIYMLNKKTRAKLSPKYPFITTYFVAFIACLGIAWAFTVLGL